jgi:hypothetical protein
MTNKNKGKVTDTRQFKLSPDVKIFTITLRPVGQTEPNIPVFDGE